MEENKAKDTFIKDSNVEITITPGESKTTTGKGKETDYGPFAIIIAIIFGLVAYFVLARHGIQIGHSQ